ncbi:GTPase, G3E family [Acinetobacter marinus]|uniref:GTPase, G3E family n=1 Tax=Acinetobacter marinus TaxID=281375 RepID=A0A1G6JMW0_9GAMM|nr:GTP-binding protein [Acinetobacter marinus]SDC20102.1 GTPase, G3E family [Acinetobacter marinus]
MTPIQAVPTHIITGFLGAGKTTLLRHLLAQKPKNEVWAVLMNEFGEIGVDQVWLEGQQGIAVKEVSGGCLCCTSQLPMQIALARLLSEFKPDRLFIEPTGLGHPRQLIEQLSQSHWKNSLALRQVVTVLNGHRLHEQLWLKHDIFLQQLEVADIVLISHQSQMTDQDQQQLQELQQTYFYPKKHWQGMDHGHVALSALDKVRSAIRIQKQALLTQQLTLTQQHTLTKQHILTKNQATAQTAPKTLPYHYHSEQQGFDVAGWHMPKSWQFNTNDLLARLRTLEQVVRIKATLNTTQGWINFNAIPNDSVNDLHNDHPNDLHVEFRAQPARDNRLEIISDIAQDWLRFEQALLQTLVSS